jgi:hypothetical protein
LESVLFVEVCAKAGEGNENPEGRKIRPAACVKIKEKRGNIRIKDTSEEQN